MKRNPIYNITIADARAARDGKYLDRVGIFNNVPDDHGQKHITLNYDRIAYWISKGAQPTEVVAKILGIVAILVLCLFVYL